jgi:hypothetical protein
VIQALLNQVVSLAPALVLALALAYLAVRHQRLFLTLFMFLTAIGSTRDFAPTLRVTFSGVSVYPEDLIMVVGAGAVLNRIGQWKLRRATRMAVIVYILLVVLGAITWISAFGGQVGANFWRLPMLSVTLLLYATTRSRAWSWDDLRVIIVAPAVVVAVASVAGILLYGFGSNSSAVKVAGGVLYDSRPVSAPGSLLMLMGLWVALLSAGKWTGRRLLTVVLLGGMVLLTQNRSVWVAAILTVVVWWLAPRFRPRGGSGGLRGLSRTIITFLVASTAALVGFSVAPLGQSASDDQTLLWRVARWAESMDIPRSGLEWIVGSALGPTPAAAPGLFPSHSLYVIATEMIGFIGLGAMLYLIVALRNAHVPPSITPLGLVVCVALLGFGVAYPLPPWAWMLAGILLASNRPDFTDAERSLMQARTHLSGVVTIEESHLGGRR